MNRFIRSRKFLVVAVILLIGTPAAWLMARTRKPVDTSLVARVKRGDFAVTVSSTGELRAPKFAKISGPVNAGQADQYQFKIEWIADEGKQVRGAGEDVVRLRSLDDLAEVLRHRFWRSRRPPQSTSRRRLTPRSTSRRRVETSRRRD